MSKAGGTAVWGTKLGADTIIYAQEDGCLSGGRGDGTGASRWWGFSSQPPLDLVL